MDRNNVEMIRNLNDSSHSLERFMRAFEVAPIRTLRKGSEHVLDKERTVPKNVTYTPNTPVLKEEKTSSIEDSE